MDESAIISRAFEVFSHYPRPDRFTDHPGCCECAEHQETLAAATPQSITRAALGTMAWDPITFTTPAAFRYYLPGMIRMVLASKDADSYYEQFLWHMGSASVAANDFDSYTAAERSIVASCLEYLFEHRLQEIEQECLESELLAAMEFWGARA